MTNSPVLGLQILDPFIFILYQKNTTYIQWQVNEMKTGQGMKACLREAISYPICPGIQFSGNIIMTFKKAINTQTMQSSQLIYWITDTNPWKAARPCKQ